MENVKMDKAFVEKMTNALPEPIDQEMQEQREAIITALFDKNPKFKEKVIDRMVRQEVKQEVRRTLLHMLAKKLQKTLSLEETQTFFVQFEQEGPDAISEKLIMLSKDELSAWFKAAQKAQTPKATPKKTPPKKTTRAKK